MNDLLYSSEESIQVPSKLRISINKISSKTIQLQKSGRRVFNRKKKNRENSKPTDSTSTLVENINISQSLNTHNLKLSLKSMYNTDPAAQLKLIFKTKNYSSSPKRHTRHVSKNYSCDIPSRKRSKLDSIFQQDEADLIMSELKTIKSPKVWQQVVQNFKKRPSALMDLIPLDRQASLPYSSTPIQKLTSPKAVFSFGKFSGTPKAIPRRHMSTNIAKPKNQATPKITRPGSATPIEVITFLEEKESERLTDDWAKSLLFKRIANGDENKLPMSLQEMIIYSRKPPREPHMIKEVMGKGLNTLRILLMELLGTKEDMERFEKRFAIQSPGHIHALMERCINLMEVRNQTSELLYEIKKRENIMKNLETSKNKIKEKVLKVYSLNKIIREKIKNWAENDSVPFNRLVFKSKDYLVKISEDAVMLQDYLAKLQAKIAKHKENNVCSPTNYK